MKKIDSIETAAQAAAMFRAVLPKAKVGGA